MDSAQSPITSESGTLSPTSFTAHHPLRKRKRTRASSTSDGDHHGQLQGGGGGCPTRELGLMRDVGKQDARFVGSGSGIHFIRNVYLRLARKSSSARKTRAEARAPDFVPGEDDHSHGQNEEPLWRPGEVVNDAEVHAAGRMSFEALVAWSRSYFETWHFATPFLDAQAVLETFEQVEKAGIESITATDRLILRSIMSISLTDRRQGAVTPNEGAIPAYLVFYSIDDALSAVQLALRKPASIRGIQAALAVQAFLISLLRLNSASRLGGLIVRMAFQLGLHRCPARFPHFDLAHRQIRRRIFWSLYMTDRFLCQSLGLPLDIRDDDVDVCYPGEEMHTVAAQPPGSLSPPTSAEPDDTRLRMLTYIAKYSRLRGLILELRNKSIHTRHDTSEEAEVVQAALAKWANEVHDAVDDDDDGHAEEDSDASRSELPPGHRLMLRLLMQEALISLNRPLMASDPDSPSYEAALQNCISSARSILGCIKRHQTRFRDQGDRLTVPMLWPSLTWGVWISSLILVYAAFEKQLPIPSALRYIEQAKQTLAHVALRGTSWPEYCISAVDELGAALREVPATITTGPNASSQTVGTSTASQLQSGSSHNPARPGGLAVRDSSQTPSCPSPAPLARRPLPSAAPTPSSPLSPRSGPAYPAGQGVVQNHPQQQQWSSSHPAEPFASPMPYIPAAGAGQAMPVDEAKESLAWYDQLFGESFSAMDFPFLAATRLDPSLDPRWSFSG